MLAAVDMAKLLGESATRPVNGDIVARVAYNWDAPAEG